MMADCRIYTSGSQTKGPPSFSGRRNNFLGPQKTLKKIQATLLKKIYKIRFSGKIFSKPSLDNTNLINYIYDNIIRSMMSVKQWLF